VGLGRGVKIPPSGVREGEISREYGCFCWGRDHIIERKLSLSNPIVEGILRKNAHKEG
jgi:hypothetical protein